MGVPALWLLTPVDLRRDFFVMPKDDSYKPVQDRLGEYFDAFVVVGYKVGTHERVAIVNATDPIARDGLGMMVKSLGDTLNGRGE